MKTSNLNTTQHPVEQLTVHNCLPKTRIYDYLRGKLATISTRKGIKKAIQRKQITLNGKTAFSGDFLKKGDEIALFQRKNIQHQHFELDLNVVYEDDDLAIVVKPAGVLTSGNSFKTLQNALLQNVKLSTQNDALSLPLPIHRLDQKTEGLVIVAKTHGSRVALGKQLECHEIQKEYRAIVQGKLEGSGVLTSAVANKNATTTFQSLEVYPSVKNKWISVLKLSPVTGRKHQLRIHLARLGFPIIGDRKHGKKGNVLKHKGLFLSATKLCFQHPKTGKEINVEVEVPNKFNRLLVRELEWSKRISDKHL